MLSYFGKILVVLGAVIFLSGIAFVVLAKLNLDNFHFPLDIYIRRKNFVFYFPLGLSLLLSVLLTLFLTFFNKK